MNLEGLTEKKNRKGTLYYENSEGEIVAKICGNCGDVKVMKDYSKDKTCLGGQSSTCKSCKLDKDLKYIEKNKEHIVKYKRNWRDSNKERNADNKRNWRRSNPEKRALSQQRRRARKAFLLDDFTAEQMAETFEYFGGCVLTGSTSDIHWDHAIPLTTGIGGTTNGNMIPLRRNLNISKNNRNIFEWFEANRQRFNLEQERFDRLIDWLGKANGMTVEEYRDYVYECHANPREFDEIDTQDGENRQAI
jgi:hypothetical protein